MRSFNRGKGTARGSALASADDGASREIPTSGRMQAEAMRIVNNTLVDKKL